MIMNSILHFQAATSRVVWSYSELDPTDPNGGDAMVHSQMGTQSLNLLARQPTENRVAEMDEPFLDITVTNVSSNKQKLV